MFRVFVLLCLLWSGTCSAGTILVFGDSLSAGFGLRPEESWPSLLQKRLQANKLRDQVVNASVSGETTAGGRSRLDAALREHKPAVLVIELGANDGLRGLPLRLMQENLDAMSRAGRKAGAKVLIVGMRLPPNYGPDYVEKFQSSFRSVAKDTGASLVPFLLEGVAEHRTLFQPDGLHPIAAAQPQILDTVWSALHPLLGR